MMERSGSGSGSSTRPSNPKIVSKDEVIAKLKDDGDFDRLRLKVIRKIKDNEELRNNIISIVKESAVLKRAGAENMKPRQLSDSIYEEIGGKAMSLISDGLWEVIRSSDGMKSEITETVESVYNKLVNPEGQGEGQTSTPNGTPVEKEAHDNVPTMASAGEDDAGLSDSEPKEPPGFSLSDNNNDSNCNHEEQLNDDLPMKEPKEEPHYSQAMLESDNVGLGVLPGFSAEVEHNQPSDDLDEDPDVPPGFG